uniref:Ribosomal protein S24/S35 mitochondrial conserved domain-containing protein n=1 Tax=Panagrolaimus sp. JU765 TaxID=591449 RepID=A0AC34R880_9BILA
MLAKKASRFIRPVVQTEVICRRHESLLADRLKRAASTAGVVESEEDQRHRLEAQVDEQGEQFRELFVMPKRKLSAQLQLERMTGRAEPLKINKIDIHDRLAVRRPRYQEMPVDQDWPSVWPAAATYKSSVVPLPIRMGSRKNPEKRAPFKRFGNLELLKIPNFLHLTPEHIKRHCEAIKKFCTPFPKELIDNPELLEKFFPVTVKYSDYLHQGTSLRDPRARINTVELKSAAFGFDQPSKDKFRHLVTGRYNEETDKLTIVTDRCFTRKQNREYADFLLTALYFESKKREKWEELRQREDNLKVEFDGSRVQERIVDFVKKTSQNGEPVLSVTADGKEINKEQILNHPTVKTFAETWYEYRNKKETPESTRSYESRVRELLGIQKLVPSDQPQKSN